MVSRLITLFFFVFFTILLLRKFGIVLLMVLVTWWREIIDQFDSVIVLLYRGRYLAQGRVDIKRTVLLYFDCLSTCVGSVS